jgi:hypothetical protein
MSDSEYSRNGLCLTAAELGLPEYGSMIAYPHPDCDLHEGGSPTIDKVM